MSKKKLPRHKKTDRVSLSYLEDDDGVYLICDCGWEYNIGFRATPAEALVAACEHTGEEPFLVLNEEITG